MIPEKEFIEKFVKDIIIENNRYSCLTMAIRDARLITGRDPATGIHKFNILETEDSFLSPYSFIGVVNYLLILDMIGEIFKDKKISVDPKKTSTIYKAIQYFGNGQSEKEIDVIIALRNSLAHNYGLVNIPRDPKEIKTKQHKFTLINSGPSQLIEFSVTNWTDFNDKRDESSTKIGHKELIDFIESIYQNLVEKMRQGIVELALKQGIEELKSRFTILA